MCEQWKVCGENETSSSSSYILIVSLDFSFQFLKVQIFENWFFGVRTFDVLKIIKFHFFFTLNPQV